MLNSLYRKMAALFFLIVSAIGIGFSFFITYTADMYQQEVAQKLNYSVAQQIVEQQSLISNSSVNKQALDELFHTLMVINPNLEIYLLNPSGQILAFSAASESVKLGKVSLPPVKRFLEHTDKRLPLLGDDPKSDSGKKKVFSAAAIEEQGKTVGYLYIILGSQLYDGIVSRLQNSYIMKISIFSVVAGILSSIVFGLVGFSIVTRRLKSLSGVMQKFNPEQPDNHIRYTASGSDHDEINQLGQQFNRMADRINSQVMSITNTDSQRRELIANISHDLRTPLTSLHGYLETLLIKEQSLSRQDRQHYLSIAYSQSNQLIGLVSSLFELAKLESCETLVNIEPFCLAELIQDVIKKFQLSAEANKIQLTMSHAEDLPFAYGDIGLIQRVLDNLIENALRHTPENGVVNVSLTANSGQIKVTVADNGYGISKQDIPHIFSRFYQQDKNRPATGGHAGLGLAIVKRIIDLHHSTIKIESNNENSTVFTFNLNAVSPAS